MEPQAWWAKVRYFKPEEFASKRLVDGKEVSWPETGLLMNMQFMLRLDALRRRLGLAIDPSSGYRTKWHNAFVKGAANSAHLYGRAVDIKTGKWTQEQRRRAIAEAKSLGFTGIGIAQTFLHLDDMSSQEGFRRPLVWWYVNGRQVFQKPAGLAWADVV